MVRLLALVALTLVAGCAAEPPRPAREPGGSASAVTYAGDIPCADCPGIRMTLTLFPDSTFRLRRTYLERSVDAYDLGRWGRTADGTGLSLRAEGERPQQFAFVGGDRLRMLDIEGREIRSPLDYDLTRTPTVDPVAGPMPLRGMYVVAGGPVFEECLTGRRLPVSPDGAQPDLERAAAAGRQRPGEPILAVLTGRFVERAGTEQLVVERFDRVSPGQACAGEPSGRALLDTRWRATEIDGHPVSSGPGGREAYLVLASQGRRVGGSSGCNSVAGGFEQDGERLRFTGLITTRMACAPPVDQQETRFLRALEATATHRVVGETLELRDAAGAPRMRLRAAPQP